MNYLSRPVFVWPIEWSNAINRSIAFDLRETSLGFGAEFFIPTETYTANGWNFTVEPTNSTDLTNLDAFMSALFGRLNGFWLPVPFESFRVIAGISSTQFKIARCGLTATWQSRPDIHLCFDTTSPFAPSTPANSENWQLAAITNSVDNGDGTETVTINTALNPAPAPGVTVRRLHYVRLAEDEEDATFVAEGWQEREFSVVELPLEYQQAETGLQPIYLYHISAPAPVSVDWYFTSFAAPVWSQGFRYNPFPMTHDSVKQTNRGDRDELLVYAKPDTSHPFSLFFPEPFGTQMNLTVFIVPFGAPDTQTLLFSGLVRTVEDNGVKYTGHCSSVLFYLDRKVPRMLIQPNCNYNLFDAPCGVVRASFETTVVLTAINSSSFPPSVTATLLFPTLLPQANNWKTTNWFQGGIFETGYGIEYEGRTITGSSYAGGVLTLTLNLPLWQAVVGQFCQITAGCDGTVNACTVKFNNFNRFGGHPFVPQRNLTLECFDNIPTSQGGKK